MKKIVLFSLIIIINFFFEVQSFCQLNPIIHKPIDLNQVSFLNDKQGWILTPYYGTILKTNDGGNTWQSQILSKEEVGFNKIRMINQSLGFILGDLGTLYKTTNGGLNWQRVYEIKEVGVEDIGPIGLNFIDIDFINDKVGFIVGTRGYILKTIDGGNSWAAKQVAGVGTINSVKCVSTNSVIAFGGVRTLIRIDNELKEDNFGKRYACFIMSNDGGEHWNVSTLSSAPMTTDYNLFPPPSFTNSSFIGKSIGFLLDSEGSLYKTIDSGNSWGKYPTNQSQKLWDVFFINDMVGYLVGTSGTIIKTINGGQDWNKQYSGVSENLNSVCFVNLNNGYVVGQGGVILRTKDGGKTWSLRKWGAIIEKQIYFHDK